MRRFELVEPTSLRDVCNVLAEHPDAKVIAGGTALLVLIKQGVYLPEMLINLKKVQGAGAIQYDSATGLRIGALATIHDVETSETVRRHYPMLAQACHLVANIRIRNMATLGGNVAHGDHQSDPPTVLAALDSRLELTSRGGTREVLLRDFLLGGYETALEAGEVVSAVLVPPLPADMRTTYLKFTTRSSEDRPCVGVAAMARLWEGVCKDVRVVVGAVSPVPVRIYEAEELAHGRPAEPALLDQIASAAAAAVEPIEDLNGPAEYKRHVVQALVRRALTECLVATPSVNGIPR